MTKTSDSRALRKMLERESKAAGFDCVGVTGAHDNQTRKKNLEQFVSKNYHGTMKWLGDRTERRASPKALWEEAESIVVLAMNYGPEHDPMAIHKHHEKGAISVYAQNRDYHDVIKGKLKGLASKLLSQARKLNFLDGDAKVFVDTAAVMEKPLAAEAGIGWQGKHTNLVSRQLGSWLFLGVIMTNLKLEQDKPEQDHCGSCRACLDVCPTNAFPAPYQIDARRCISYLTIEHDGMIDEELRPLMGNRIFGCDDCLAVCPWNKYAQTTSQPKLLGCQNTSSDLLTFLKLSDQKFRLRFSGSPVKRIGRNRFVRNCLIAAANSKNKKMFGEVVRGLVQDDNPVVSKTAEWAAEQLEKPKQ